MVFIDNSEVTVILGGGTWLEEGHWGCNLEECIPVPGSPLSLCCMAVMGLAPSSLINSSVIPLQLQIVNGHVSKSKPLILLVVAQ